MLTSIKTKLDKSVSSLPTVAAAFVLIVSRPQNPLGALVLSDLMSWADFCFRVLVTFTASKPNTGMRDEWHRH